MPKTKISEFSSTPANNTDIDSINIAEGCAPSGINDAIRELMSQLKDFQTGAVGDSFNGPIGTTTAAAGAFTTLSASSTLAVTGVATLTAQPILSSLTASRAVFTDASKGLVSNAITGTGNVVMSTSPTLVTPTLGVATATSLQGIIGNVTPAAGTFTSVNATSVTNSALTSGRVTYAGASGLLVDSANLTFSGTSLTLKNGYYEAYDPTDSTSAGVGMRFYTDGGGTKTENGRLTVAQTATSGSLSSMIFQTNNGTSLAEQMRLTSTGLGIGTSSPSTKLDVSGTAPTVTVQPSSGTASSILDLKNPSQSWQIQNQYVGGAAVGMFRIYDVTNTTDRLVINPASGNVGIGTSSPSAKLDVAGSAYVRGDSSNATFTSAGQVAIKRSSGDPVLSFHGNTGTQIGNIQFQDAGTCSITVAVAQPLAFTVNGSERARIDSSGNLLVGTTTKNNMNGTLLQTLGSSGIIDSSSASVAQNGTVVINAASSGGSFTGFLSVSNVLVSNANIRTQTLYAIMGRGTTMTATQLATANGSTSGASFTVTCPSTGAITVTNTYAGATQVNMTYIGNAGG